MRFMKLFFVALFAVVSAWVGLIGGSSAQAADALAVVNLQRSYLGLPALLPDPSLQGAAERAVATRAARGRTGHLGGGPVAGKFEGVGYTSQSDRLGIWFRSCYTRAPSIRYAGAAFTLGRDGRTYYQFNAR